MKAKIILIAEVDYIDGDKDQLVEEVSDRMDALSDSGLPPGQHGITLSTATREDLETFVEAGRLLPNPGPIIVEE